MDCSHFHWASQSVTPALTTKRTEDPPKMLADKGDSPTTEVNQQLPRHSTDFNRMPSETLMKMLVDISLEVMQARRRSQDLLYQVEMATSLSTVSLSIKRNITFISLALLSGHTRLQTLDLPVRTSRKLFLMLKMHTRERKT